ncbi:unnamed protein product [Effrenium voratum]|uniref:Uncharacterized protein n=1 Tax=Effrenium voratum TaxID=2562239 RepID=A0AA36INB5_9DINO|nr:unnamed protein product [Effrenium voratum]CAJ1390677.1 unnamed protein product [Effrenium voratum]CAJ1454797.1 unnamed protein product [Effrenium voratum]CAJ1460642.1 unnamed protein product [Effrenium voratum]
MTQLRHALVKTRKQLAHVKQGSQRQAVLSEYEKELVQLISRGYEGLREHGTRQRLEDAGEDVEAQMASLEETLVKFTQKVLAKFAAIRHPLAEMCGAADSAVAKPSESAADDDTLRQYFQASLSLEDTAEKPVAVPAEPMDETRSIHSREALEKMTMQQLRAQLAPFERKGVRKKCDLVAAIVRKAKSSADGAIEK